jgi:SHS2 domain-containing protein
MDVEHTLKWLKFVDHTADAGIVVEGPDLARLFERAAWGMFS